jgi:hypothetical protein
LALAENKKIKNKKKQESPNTHRVTKYTPLNNQKKAELRQQKFTNDKVTFDGPLHFQIKRKTSPSIRVRVVPVISMLTK